MCRGHPHDHPCGHQSVTWNFCLRATIDAQGVELPCELADYVRSVPVNGKCPLENCNFRWLGGCWDCCKCGQGPNTRGWCTFKKPEWKMGPDGPVWVETCDHGCCENCTRNPNVPTPSPPPPLLIPTGPPTPQAMPSKPKGRGSEAGSSSGGGGKQKRKSSSSSHSRKRGGKVPSTAGYDPTEEEEWEEGEASAARGSSSRANKGSSKSSHSKKGKERAH